MKSTLKWLEGMKFEAQADNNKVLMDAKSPIGKGSEMTPKELVVTGLGGCTVMDVIAYLKKFKQNFTSLEIDVNVESSQGVYPAVFTKAELEYRATGDIDPKILLEAAHLSQTKYCGVSAMLAKAFPISYKVVLNGQQIGTGEAKF